MVAWKWYGAATAPSAAIVRERLVVTAVFAGAAVLATWPLVRYFGSALPNDLADPLLNAWILAWDADRLLHGLRGLWQAPIFHPYPNTLAYSEHLLGIAIFTAPIQWLTGIQSLPTTRRFWARSCSPAAECSCSLRLSPAVVRPA